MNLTQLIANELQVKTSQVEAAIKLLDEGATVPFIARYRKEMTDGLDDTQLRTLNERLIYGRELNTRREAILKSIDEQKKLTPELKQKILAADNKAALEDLYLPYKPKRQTKAQLAKEAGLAPLADILLTAPADEPIKLAAEYLNPAKKIQTAEEALAGAQQILMEQFSEHADLLAELRNYCWQHGKLRSQVLKDQEEKGQKFKDYFDYQETVKTIPSHRLLAVLRGRKENILRVNIILDEDRISACEAKIAAAFNIIQQDTASSQWLWQTVQLTWKLKLLPKLSVDIMLQCREMAETEAIKVFANNLKNLLMAAPAGNKVTLGLDPGYRTGVKTVVVDGTGKLLMHTVIYPHAPQKQWQAALATLQKLCEQFQVELISIGNGTASRETEQLVRELVKAKPQLKYLVTSEAGASVYSASELAAKEFPDLDVSYRGAVSIARRLQDPLAELIKIDPKSIGVGQYQHDVNQIKLGRSLQGVLEDCVNAVGVDVNTASIPLLTSVSGLTSLSAKRLVEYRDQHGAFKNRDALKNVPHLGNKAFEQAAGFLRINNGDNPLDASAVHPEAYPVVTQILKQTQQSIHQLMGNQSMLQSIQPQQFTDEKFGLPTVQDILQELSKPGRDPRPEFTTVEFKEGVTEISDVKPGMILQGVVTNVTNFGAFVDIGVHQDGLVHTSQLANHFVKDPHDVVSVGQILQVKVLEVDVARKRISLSCRLDEAASKNTAGKQKPKQTKKTKQPPKDNPSAFANALASALK
jgi:protein Tex